MSLSDNHVFVTAILIFFFETLGTLFLFHFGAKPWSDNFSSTNQKTGQGTAKKNKKEGHLLFVYWSLLEKSCWVTYSCFEGVCFGERCGEDITSQAKHTPSKHRTHTTKQAGKMFCSCWLVKLEAVNKEFCRKLVSSGSSSHSATLNSPASYMLYKAVTSSLIFRAHFFKETCECEPKA